MNFKLFFLSISVFVIVDSIWLLLIADGFYQSQIGWLLAEKPNLVAAGMFYLIFLFGLNFFVIQRSHCQKMGNVLLQSFVYGFVTYATFDLTNQAVVRDWPWIVTFVDLLWGITVCMVTSFCSVSMARKLKILS